MPPGLAVVDASAAGLSPLGRLLLNATLSRQLVRRGAFLRLRRERPDALAQPLRKPLVVTGLHRTGTTTLQRLLAQDPEAMHLPMWLMLANTLPDRVQFEAGMRKERRFARFAIGFWNHLVPEMDDIHAVAPDLPEEEMEPLIGGFCSPALYLRAAIPRLLRLVDRAGPGARLRVPSGHAPGAPGGIGGRPLDPQVPDPLAALWRTAAPHARGGRGGDPPRPGAGLAELPRPRGDAAPTWAARRSTCRRRSSASAASTRCRSRSSRTIARRTSTASTTCASPTSWQTRSPPSTASTTASAYAVTEPFQQAMEAFLEARARITPATSRRKPTLEDYGLTAEEVRDEYAEYLAQYG